MKTKQVCLIFFMALLQACGGGGSGGGDNNSTDLKAADLAGTWGGTIESSSQGLSSLTIDFDSNGNISSVAIGGVDQGLSAALEGTSSSSDRIFTYTVDGTSAGIYVDEAGEHAGVLLANGSLGVLQKGATSGTFAESDATGAWAGESVFVVAPFEADGIDSVTGSFTVNNGNVQSSDFSFSSNSGSCTGIDVSLTGFQSATGVYDLGTASGGSGTDCPEGAVAADAYMSYDGDFMLIYAGCEANIQVNECSVVTLSRTGSGDDSGGGDVNTVSDFSGSWNGSGTQRSDCGDDGTNSATLSISQSGSSAMVGGYKADGTSFSATVDGNTLSSDTSFSYPDGVGTTTETGWSATLDASGSNFTGNSNFSYSEAGFSCSGTITFEASRN